MQINYAFMYMCPPPGTNPMPYWSVPPYGTCTDATAFQLLSVDPHDPSNLATIVGYKATNPALKVLLSVGGWNYPSAYFSAMASTAANRAIFIASVKSWIAQYNVDGVDIDWEYPCSPARSDPVEITCTDFQTVPDAGGNCPEDTANIVSLFQELRTALGPAARITVASQASKPLEAEMSIAQLEPYVDAFHLMTYDYTVSDITGAGAVLAPNAPLYTPANPNVTQMSISYTIENYLNATVPPEKIMVGIALYGHTWFSPGLSGNAWEGFGQPAYVQGACCGPFVSTNGAKPGQGSSLCGTYMYSEIVAAGAQMHTLDNATGSDIAYFTAMGADGYTAPGTWLTYTGPDSAQAIIAYAKSKNLAGAFVFDSSMDTLTSGGQWTYELTNTIADALGAPPASATPAAPQPPVIMPSTSTRLSSSSSSSSPAATTGNGTAPFVGGYVMMDGPEGLAKVQLLASQAATLPINRLWLAFVSPTLVYVPGSQTLEYTGLNLTTSSTGDFGFAALAAAIATLNASGVEVFISMGGWDYSCFPMMYTLYSVGGYGTNTPNYWKITEYCAGSTANGSPANEYCYTCEPPAANETLNYFGIFPEPSYSATWQAAVKFVEATAAGANPPKWDTDLNPGQSYTDPTSGMTSVVPGSPLPAQMQRDPYADVVHLAAELGAAGVDVDYEEDWFVDSHKAGPAGGPWTLEQGVYKFAAILKDVSLNIAAIAPGLKLSIAASAAGGWAGNWWGGNEKGTILFASQWYPDLIAQVASTGGVNIMSYDLSDDEQYYECPEPGVCTLDQQVAFYMQQFDLAGIPANVGYETGTPAYPDPVEDPSHQLPLTLAELQLITANTQPKYKGGFMWEVFKQPVVEGEATPTQVAQAICNVVLPGSPRCNGSLPIYSP